ncbi:MAG TPA: hypothetical protein VM032_15645 [Vicinamibacterales bacterium]|nr:hypothetical protein [Vicinamibacterales bacterium]
MRVCAFLLILSTAGVATASSQSLADIARKENDRRGAVKGAGKTYTDKDLKPVPAPPSDTDATTPAPDAPGDGKAAADEKPEVKAKAADEKTADGKVEVKDQAYWARRMANLVEQLERDETFLAALQNRIDSLTTDFVNRDDPAQKNQIQADRQKALGELDRLKKAVADDKRAIPDLEEEARREGVPAGWLR